MTIQYAKILSRHGGAGIFGPYSIVVHSMAEFIDTEDRDYFAVEWLEKLGLSAHVLVTPSGVPIQTREFNTRAWHARQLNGEALGIEILVAGLHTYETFLEAIKVPNWPTAEQMRTTYAVVREWLKGFPDIKMENILRHSDVSPGRKVDPGSGFAWDLFLEELEVVDAEM